MDNQVLDQYINFHTDNMEEKKKSRKLFSRIGFALTILVVTIQVFEAVFYTVVDGINPDLWTLPWMQWLMIAVGFYFTSFPVFCILMKQIPNLPKGKPKKMKLGKLISFFVIGMATLYIFNYLSFAINYAISTYKGSEVVNPLATAIDSSNVFFTFLVVGIIAPIIEEVLFRSILLDKLRLYGEKTAIWVTSIAFGLFHLNTSQLFYATALGVLLAYIAVKTNRIKYCIILHIAINIIGSVVGPLLASTEYAILVGAMVILFIISGIILFIIMKKQPITEDEVEQPVVQKVSKVIVLGNPGMITYIVICLVLIVITTLM